MTYPGCVPKLWNETIDAHRAAVRAATLEATVALVAEHGLAAVTMSQIAKQTGIGRATLYKYFPDVESILIAWHERHVADHLDQLTKVRDRSGDPGQRLEAVLQAFAMITYERPTGGEVAALVHRGEHLERAEEHLKGLVRDLLAEAAQAGQVRGDITADELATYCLHALSAAGTLHSKAAVQRLVTLTLTGIRRP